MNFKIKLDEKYEPIVTKFLDELITFSIETYHHVINTSDICLILGKKLGFSDLKLKTLYTAALIHDVGKLKMDKEILHGDNITQEQREYLHEHVEYSYQMTKDIFDEEIALLVYRHHERPNGTGYPNKIGGETLSKTERLLAVCDVTSALILPRSYKVALSKEKVIAILLDMGKKGDLDFDLVNLAIEEYVKKVNWN